MRGGKRENSGRKKKAPKKTICIRIDDQLHWWLKKTYKRNLNKKITNYLIELKNKEQSINEQLSEAFLNITHVRFLE